MKFLIVVLHLFKRLANSRKVAAFFYTVDVVNFLLNPNSPVGEQSHNVINTFIQIVIPRGNKPLYFWKKYFKL